MKEIEKRYTYNNLKYVEKINKRMEEIKQIENEIENKKEQREKIQKNFNFKIPLYILDEIAEHGNYNKINLFLNMAIKAESLSAEEVQEIRKYLKNI